MTNSGFNRPLSLKEYRRKKINMLQKGFKLRLTEEEVEHFYELKTDFEIDQYARDLISKKL